MCTVRLRPAQRQRYCYNRKFNALSTPRQKAPHNSGDSNDSCLCTFDLSSSRLSLSYRGVILVFYHTATSFKMKYALNIPHSSPKNRVISKLFRAYNIRRRLLLLQKVRLYLHQLQLYKFFHQDCIEMLHECREMYSQ